MRIRLTRKLADCLDGVDVSHYSAGDVLDLPTREAHLLVAEGWAVLSGRAAFEPEPWTPTDEEVRCIGEQLENWSERRDLRRAEDRIREELRDSRAVIVRVEKRKKRR